MTAPVSGSNALTTNTATTSVTRDDQMDKDTFLKLLVAQLKYQDPSDPASSSELLAQTATLAQVQSLDAIAKQNSQSLTLQKSLSAGALVGHPVTWTDDSGQKQTGTVTSVVLGDGTTESTATIDGTSVPMGRITEVA